MSAKIIYGVFKSPPTSEARGRQIARLREIETAAGQGNLGKKGYVFTSEKDRIIVATEVGRIVRAAREHGVSVGDIKAELDRVGRTTRIDRYMISTSRSEDAVGGRATKLQSKVSGYLDVAAAVADLTGRDAEALKIEVLCKTSLWERDSLAQRVEDPRAHYLALQLNEMATSIQRKQHLSQLFEKASRVPGEWDLESSKFRDAFSPCLPDATYLEGLQHWTEAPPLPSALLARHLHAVFPMQFDIDSNGRPERLSSEELEASLQRSDVDRIDGRIELWRETRLAIGPLTSLQSIGALFETRAHVRIVANHGGVAIGAVHPSCTLKPIKDDQAYLPEAVFQSEGPAGWQRISTVGRIDDAEALVASTRSRPDSWAPGSINGTQDVEHWYLSWAAVNDTNVAEFLDRPVIFGRSEAASMAGRHAGKPVWYAAGTLAHHVEEMLASGALEAELTRQAKLITSELQKHEEAWKQRALEVHEQRMSGWAREADTELKSDGN